MKGGYGREEPPSIYASCSLRGLRTDRPRLRTTSFLRAASSSRTEQRVEGVKGHVCTARVADAVAGTTPQAS